MPPEEAFQKSRAAATKALEIDDTLAEAHTLLGIIKLQHDWDWSGAEMEFKQALELNPGYAGAHQWYSAYLTAMGRHREAIAEIRRAQELDPLSAHINMSVAVRVFMARQYDQAIEQCQKTLEMDPNFATARYWLGLAYEQKGRYKEALTELQKARDLLGQKELAGLVGHTYAVAGKRGEALKILNELLELSKRKDEFIDPSYIAYVYIGLGEKDQAFEWLNKAVERRSGELFGLKVDPVFDPLRSDPRFQELLRRVGLVP